MNLPDKASKTLAGRLASKEILCCVSGIVARLASNRGNLPFKDLADLTEQAMALAVPLPDYESAADEAGFTRTGDGMCIDLENNLHCSAEAACDHHRIEPHDREVLEHWAVTAWLADKLEAKGEKVDLDFAALIVWARTTTGQAISADAVIEAIVAETGYAGGGEG